MVKALTKPAFGVPSTELIGRIEASDAVSMARAAGYRFEVKLGELGRQYEVKASELRDAYLAELSALGSGEEASVQEARCARRVANLRSVASRLDARGAMPKAN